jgi:hypothetical protein
MKKLSTISKCIEATLLTPRELATSKQVKIIDIYQNPKHILTPPIELRDKSAIADIASEYLDLLLERYQKSPQVFVKGLLKLLEYHDQGVQVQLDDGGAGYAEQAKVFFIAFAEHIYNKITKEGI